MKVYIFAFAHRGRPHLDKIQTFTSKDDLVTKIKWYQTHGTRDQRMDISEYGHGGWVAIETITDPTDQTTSRSIKKEIRQQITYEDFNELLKLPR